MSMGFDTVVSFTAPEAGNWIFSTSGSDYDTVLYARSACADTATELDCNDDSGLGEEQLERWSSRLKLTLEQDRSSISSLTLSIALKHRNPTSRFQRL